MRTLNGTLAPHLVTRGAERAAGSREAYVAQFVELCVAVAGKNNSGQGDDGAEGDLHLFRKYVVQRKIRDISAADV